MSLPALVLIAGLALDGAPVRALCECFCVDGTLLTLCTSVEAASGGIDRCSGRSVERCPARLEVDAPRQYAAPVAGAENCREVQVYDPGSAVHRPVRVCDVTPAERP